MQCSICDKDCKDLRTLSTHISTKHPEIDSITYTVEYFYNNGRPKCGCGCGEITRYKKLGQFADFVSGHNSRVNNGFKGKKRSKEHSRKTELGKKKFWENNSHPNKKEKIKLQCKNCNVDMFVIPALQDTKKYCSKKCYSEYKIKSSDYIVLPETRTKLRIASIDQRSKMYVNAIWPAYNPDSIPILEAKAKELGITDLQHAENGGEFQVLGYFVDGYSKEKNIAIEYDEKHHFNTDGNYNEKDILRQKEIEEYLGCKFIRIKQKN